MAYGIVNTPSSPGQGGGKRLIIATIGTEWTDNAEIGTKEQFVAIEGITAEDDVVVGPVNIHERTAQGYPVYVEEHNQFLTHITNGDAETVDGGIKFYIFKEATTIPIYIGVEVI